MAFPETDLVGSVRERTGSGRRAPRARDVDRSPHRPLRAGVSAVGDASHSRPARTKPSAFPRVSQRAPLHRRPCWRPLPRALTRFGTAPPGATLVPPTPFLTASTASSAHRFAGLLRPASDPEVHRVAAHQRRMPAITSALSHRCPPSRAFPFREAVPASPRGLAPLSFPGNAGATSRPCSARKSVTAAARGRTALLDALLGFPTWSPTRTRLPPACPRRAAMRGAEGPRLTGRSGGRVRDASATAVRGLRPHRVRGGGRKGSASPPPTMPGSRPSAPPPERCPRRSFLEGRSSSRVGPAAPRGSIGCWPAPLARRARAAAASELSKVPPPRGVDRACSRSLCSAAFREVGGRRRGVHVPSGLIGSRSVARGRAIRAKTPALARRRKVPPNVSPGVRPDAPARIAALRGPIRDVRG